MSEQPLSIFISSKMQELAEERRQVQAALAAYRMAGWLWETDAGARPEPIRSTYLQEVEDCDIYLGLFWLGYGPYTIEEYEHARLRRKPCLIYEKRSGLAQRDPQLQAFLDRLQKVDSPSGLTIARFKSAEELAQQVQKDVLRLLTTTFRQSRQQPPLFLVPYPRNPFFTGREQLLQQLHEHFQQTSKAALTQSQAITGLGGIGKTQLAVEYAYRYQHEYRHVLWANATTALTLTESYVTIARKLQLPQADEADQTIIVEAVKDWLRTHDNWLLILDNADDLAMTASFLPTGEKGHVLLTTREAATRRITPGFAVDKMSQDEGVLFLLRRAGLLPASETSLLENSENDLRIAREIVHELDGLPLALEQAGAYIEDQDSTLGAYLKAYRRRQSDLLSKQGRIHPDYPYTVATTWSLNFEQIERDDPRAAALLRFLSFLAPDAIPEELIIAGASELGPDLQALKDDETLLDEAIGTLRHFSLIQRNSEQHLLFIHRLMQTVLKTSMNETTCKQWAEQTVQAVNLAFPPLRVDSWPQCERQLPHALVCADLIETYCLLFPRAARLLNQTGLYLCERAQYILAAPLLKRALAMSEQLLDPSHPNMVSSLNNLALLYYRQGNYEQAEPLNKRALAISEQVFGPNHPRTALSLNNLGELYRVQSDHTQAEPLLKRALAIYEQVLGSNHPDTALSLGNLALIYFAQGNYAQAEPLLKRALAIYEQVLGPSHPNTARILNNLAMLYQTQSDYEQAEPLLKRALAISEEVFGPNNPNTARNLNNLAVLYERQSNYDQAEPLLKRALAIREQVLGPDHPETAASFNNLGSLYQNQGNYAQAEPLLRRSLVIHERVLGPNHPDTAYSLNNLASLYEMQGNYSQAELFLKRALTIREQMLGPNHPETAASLNNLGGLYRKQGNYTQAELFLRRALAIYEQMLGPNHPDTATSLNNLAILYETLGNHEQAEQFYKRALSIKESTFGPNHPDTTQSLTNLALLYYRQGNYAQAEPLLKRALAIREKVLGPDHPETAQSLNNLALLYFDQGLDVQAEQLLKRALIIRERVFGSNDPITKMTRDNYTILLQRSSSRK